MVTRDRAARSNQATPGAESTGGIYYPDVSYETSPIEVLAELNRIVTPHGVQETHVVEAGGVPHVVSVRGRHRGNPVLLMVHGGPATPLAPTGWMWQRPVEEYFTVVHYDQRAAGRTHALTDIDVVGPTLRLEQYVDDAVEIARWLCQKMGVLKVAVCGHSWGSAVATLAVLQAPDLFSVYVGVGQVVSFEEAEPVSWQMTRAAAEQQGLDDGVAALDALRPYPDPAADLLPQITVEREWVGRTGGFAAGRADCDYFMSGVSPDYTAADLEASSDGNELTAAVMVSQLLSVDLRHVAAFPVPMVQVLGRHDAMTPTGTVEAWLNRLDVPRLIVEWFEDSAHMAMYEEPGHFLVTLLKHVRPAALGEE